MLDSHVPRDQKHEQFQEDSRLLLHHFVDCRATAPAKGGVHLPDGVRVEGVTRALGISAKVLGRFDRSKMMAGLRQLLSDVQLRRRRNAVLQDLPPKLSSTVYVELTPRQRAVYRRPEREGIMGLEALGRELQITHVLELILRLKQICNFCPESGESSKLADLKERLAMTVDSGAKSLVFSQFVEEPFGARRLARELAGLSPFLLVGDIDPTTRANRAVVFERDPQRQIMVMSLKAGGVGLNLTSASHVFHFHRWWNPAVEAQAEDRTTALGNVGRSTSTHIFAATRLRSALRKFC